MFVLKDVNLKEFVVVERVVVLKCREDVEVKCIIIKLFFNLILKDVFFIFIKLLFLFLIVYEYCF